MSYEDTLKRLGETTARSLRSIYEQWQATAIDLDTAKELWAVVLETAGVQGENLGALSFTTYADVALGSAQPVALGGSSIASNPATNDRVAKALKTVLAGNPEEIAMRLERLGFADPVNTAQDAFANLMRGDPRVDGWVRGLEADACQLCRWWWREGRMWGKDHVMPTHTGCTCHQVPAFKKKRNGSWGNVETSAVNGPTRQDRGGGLKPKRRR